MRGVRRCGVMLTSGSPEQERLLDKLGLRCAIEMLPSVSRDCPSALGKRRVPVCVSHRGTRTCHGSVTRSRLVVATSAIIYVGRGMLKGPQALRSTGRVLQRLSNGARRMVAKMYLVAHNLRHAFSTAARIAFSMLARSRVRFCMRGFQPLSGTKTCKMRR